MLTNSDFFTDIQRVTNLMHWHCYLRNYSW